MIEAINKALDRVEGGAMIICMITATVIAVTQVAARYVFNNSLYWAEEVVLYSLIIMSFFAASMGVRYGAHIAVEVLNIFAGPRAAKYIKIIAATLGVLFALSLLYYGGRLFLNTYKLGQLSPALRIPVSSIYAAIPIAGLFMVFRYVGIFAAVIQDKPITSPSSEITSM